MRRAVAAALAALFLVAVSTPADARPRAASGPAGMTYTLYQQNIQNPVEQETDYPFPEDQSLWVINPIPNCAWDVDDFWQKIAHGSLRAGETLAIDECVIASPRGFVRTINGVTASWSNGGSWYGVQVRADINALSVTECYQPEGRCFTLIPVYDAPSRSWVYNLCTNAQFNNDDPVLVEIPGSQGGIGLVQTVTVTLSNPTSHTARNVTSSVGAVGVSQQAMGWGGCIANAPIVTDYPFRYTQ